MITEPKPSLEECIPISTGFRDSLTVTANVKVGKVDNLIDSLNPFPSTIVVHLKFFATSDSCHFMMLKILIIDRFYIKEHHADNIFGTVGIP
ncbi:hypothetical protein GJ496_008581 [Pomphorhynchus laevis]|nr:hypothetical protein GJ496_008581 [Pomphorhynchus laevis]